MKFIDRIKSQYRRKHLGIFKFDLKKNQNLTSQSEVQTLEKKPYCHMALSYYGNISVYTDMDASRNGNYLNCDTLF